MGFREDGPVVAVDAGVGDLGGAGEEGPGGDGAVGAEELDGARVVVCGEGDAEAVRDGLRGARKLVAVKERDLGGDVGDGEVSGAQRARPSAHSSIAISSAAPCARAVSLFTGSSITSDST